MGGLGRVTQNGPTDNSGLCLQRPKLKTECQLLKDIVKNVLQINNRRRQEDQPWRSCLDETRTTLGKAAPGRHPTYPANQSPDLHTTTTTEARLMKLNPTSRIRKLTTLLHSARRVTIDVQSTAAELWSVSCQTASRNSQIHRKRVKSLCCGFYRRFYEVTSGFGPVQPHFSLAWPSPP